MLNSEHLKAHESRINPFWKYFLVVNISCCCKLNINNAGIAVLIFNWFLVFHLEKKIRRVWILYQKKSKNVLCLLFGQSLNWSGRSWILNVDLIRIKELQIYIWFHRNLFWKGKQWKRKFRLKSEIRKVRMKKVFYHSKS